MSVLIDGTNGITVVGITASGAISTTSNISAAGTVTSSSTSQNTGLGVGTSASATTGEIRATNNVTAYYSSDKRLKENVQPIENALDKVAQIGGCTFDWTEDYIQQHGGIDGYFVRKQDFGVIAQDVEKVFPVAVRMREDGYLAVDYERLVSLAFAAIKELQEKVDNLSKD